MLKFLNNLVLSIIYLNIINFRNVSIDLHENSTFQSICYDIWKKTSHFEAHHVITLYKNFQLLEINSEYLLMQALLQVKHNC